MHKAKPVGTPTWVGPAFLTQGGGKVATGEQSSGLHGLTGPPPGARNGPRETGSSGGGAPGKRHCPHSTPWVEMIKRYLSCRPLLSVGEGVIPIWRVKEGAEMACQETVSGGR